MIKKISVLFGILLLISQLVAAQDKSDIPDSESDTEELFEESIPAVKIIPVLPQTGSSVIFIEGEDAVATNFNREPILNYSCSGYRTL
ncbi:MAG: hypothetical protein KAR21_16120, partial [Spirochaetales bacterium]|nr:hypothetical protein [Spirochaetales bacterium]